MKKSVLFLSLSFIICSLHGWRECVDKIVLRVNGANILKSDVEQPRLDKGGKTYSIDELVDNELLFQKAAERKLLPTGTDIEKNMTSWKTANNFTHMSDDQLSERLKTEGFSLEKYKNQLGRILSVRNIKQLEISERVVVTSKEIEGYFKKKPQYAEEQYLVQTALIPFDEAKNIKKIDNLSKRKDLEWINVDWIEKSNVAEKMKFICSMKKGEISKAVKTDDGYQLIKLIDRHDRKEKTLDESWVSIEKKLQDEKKDSFEREFVRELREKASVVYV